MIQIERSEQCGLYENDQRYATWEKATKVGRAVHLAWSGNEQTRFYADENCRAWIELGELSSPHRMCYTKGD